MTKLEQIVKRAKQIRLAQPKKFAKWTDYVKYASKDLADKVVGKKKTVGAALAKSKKKAIAPIKKKPIAAAKKTKTTHKDTKSHNVRINVVSGISSANSFSANILKQIDENVKRIINLKKQIENHELAIKKPSNKMYVAQLKKQQTANKKILRELQTHEKELIKIFKSNF